MTTITLPRATVEQALEAMKVAADHYHTYPGHSVRVFLETFAALRAALAQQAEPVNVAGPAHLAPKPAPGLEFDERGVLVPQQTEPVHGWTDADADAARLALELECLLTDKDVPLAAASRWWSSAHEALQLHRKRLNAALAQQAEPDHETRAELAEQQVAQLAEERDHYRNLWQKAQQAELVLQGPVRIKPGSYTLGATWVGGGGGSGGVGAPPQQAEPVEPPKPAPLKRGITGRCTRKVCECEKEGLGPECIHLEPVIDGYPLWSGIPKAEPLEPVAWMLTDAQNPRVRFLEWQKETRAYSGAWIKTPLYTAPQQRKPLTSDEIQTLWSPYRGAAPFSFARAIEHAHGIKE